MVLFQNPKLFNIRKMKKLRGWLGYDLNLKNLNLKLKQGLGPHRSRCNDRKLREREREISSSGRQNTSISYCTIDL